MMSNKVITCFCKLATNGLWLGLSDAMIATLGIELETLLRMDFVISINEDKIVIESHILG